MNESPGSLYSKCYIVEWDVGPTGREEIVRSQEVFMSSGKGKGLDI